MNTNMNFRNDRLRQEMEVNPTLKKVIAIHHITQVVAIILCAAVSSINFILLCFHLLVVIPIILFIVLLVASKCNFQDLIAILVQFNPILSTMWFLSIFPVFIITFFLNQYWFMYTTNYADISDARVTIVAIMTCILSLSSAIFAVMGIWKSARNVVLIARSGDRDHVSSVGCVPTPYDAPVNLTDLSGIPITQALIVKPPMFNQGILGDHGNV
ncbi:hypothetical protein CHS0354_039560 [Potamilus streckersoni]|uniref:Uncharacterized protein n=1 Tax=Potamilus streckersoni TaxID=2493646 RepID=A0AAE0W2W2_9BIVA|nr:hypothetical protein CHS0354_039560 [Potamilus streckersoni]